jgi:energy-converting hydrogenase A subunit M
MELEMLMHRYLRLRAELAAAYHSRPWQSDRIDPLADDLAEVEQRIAILRPRLPVADLAMLAGTTSSAHRGLG